MGSFGQGCLDRVDHVADSYHGEATQSAATLYDFSVYPERHPSDDYHQ